MMTQRKKMCSIESGLFNAMGNWGIKFSNLVLEELYMSGSPPKTLKEARNILENMDVDFNLNKKKKGNNKKAVKKITNKPDVPLPWCGKITDDWCFGVISNRGMHTQCMKGREQTCDYCTRCKRLASESPTDKPPLGDIRDRSKFGIDYRTPNGKSTVPFANIAKKFNFSKSKAEAAAAKMGWTIPEEQFTLRVSKRGRPRKTAAVSDTDDSVASSSEKKKVEKKTTTKKQDIIASLAAEAAKDIFNDSKNKKSKNKKSKNKKSKKETKLDIEELIASVELESENDSSSSEEELELETKIIDGVKFVYDEKGEVHGKKHLLLKLGAYEPVGVFDVDSGKMLEVNFEIDSDSSDSDSESDSDSD